MLPSLAHVNFTSAGEGFFYFHPHSPPPRTADPNVDSRTPATISPLRTYARNLQAYARDFGTYVWNLGTNARYFRTYAGNLGTPAGHFRPIEDFRR